MSPAELRGRLAALASRALPGRNVYALAGDVELPAPPAEVHTERIDAVAFLTGRAWSRGAAERRRELNAALAERLHEAAARSGPVLLVIDRADALVGELDSLAPLYDRFVGDERMVLIRCAAPPGETVLPDDVPLLAFTPGAAMRRLAREFRLEAIEADA